MKRIIDSITDSSDFAAASSDVLIISDDALLSLDLSMALDPRGFVPVTRGHAEVAQLMAAGTNGFKAVIVDIVKHDSATRALLEWVTAQPSPVIVVSTFEEEEQARKVAAWYLKPLSVENLFDSGTLKRADKDDGAAD